MFGVMRPLVLAAGLLVAFAAPAAATPTWLAPQDLSIAPATGTPSSSVVASDAAGETFAAWDLTDGTNVRVQLAMHAPGQPWSAATNLSDAGADASAPSLSLSSTGFGAIAWTRSDGAHQRLQVSRRVPGGAFGPADTISLAGVDASNAAIATDAVGDVSVIWLDPASNVVHARRYTAALGTWGSIDDLTPATNPSNQILWFLTLAISPSGEATAAWVLDTDPGNATGNLQFEIQTRTQGTNGTWTPMVQLSSNVEPVLAGNPQLAVDAAGNVTIVWFEYTTMSCGFLCVAYASGVIREATRPETSGVWQGAVTLSDPIVISDSPRVVTTPAGEVTVAWTENAAQAIKVVTRPVGGAFPPASGATIVVPQDKPIVSGTVLGIPLTSLHMATGPSGTIVTFARQDGTNYLAEAVFRPAGGSWPNPATTPPTALSAPGTDIGSGDGPNITFDGLGNAVATWTRGSVIQTAAFDASPPAFTAVNVPATGTTGQPVAASASTLDTWSALGAGQPSWNFGDGKLASGSSVTHVYAAPGTYTVSVSASDAVGNASPPATRQIVITNAPVPPPPPTPPTSIAKPKVKAVWKASHLAGTVSVSGTVGANTTLTVTVRRHGARKTALKSTFKVKTGKWTRTLKLPASLTPGKYDVIVTGTGVKSSQTSFTLAAPKSGIVKRSYATGPRRGPAATTLGSTSELWAHFVFGTLPARSQTITTQWTLPGGRKLGANTRPRTSLVEAQVKDLSGKALPTGVWHCVIRAGGTIVATLNVRLK